MIEGITKPEGDVDGDNLKLNPKEIRPHLGGIDFGKMEGREELDVERDG